MGLKEVRGASHMAIWGKCGPEREVVGLPEGERGTPCVWSRDSEGKL